MFKNVCENKTYIKRFHVRNSKVKNVMYVEKILQYKNE